jgi:hypothetical protein
MPALIYFTSGEKVTVQPDVKEVVNQLKRGKAKFARFEVVGGLEIHVVPDHVAFVAQVPESGDATAGG